MSLLQRLVVVVVVVEESLTEHLLINKKDYACQRGLRILLGQRSRLTKYLQKTDYAEYERVMNGLGLRIKSA